MFQIKNKIITPYVFTVHNILGKMIMIQDHYNMQLCRVTHLHTWSCTISNYKHSNYTNTGPKFSQKIS